MKVSQAERDFVAKYDERCYAKWQKRYTKALEYGEKMIEPYGVSHVLNAMAKEIIKLRKKSRNKNDIQKRSDRRNQRV